MNEAPGILVTGATGFIGRELVQKLAARGARVRALGRRPMIRWRGRAAIEHVRADITEPGVIERAIDRVHTIFHLAAATAGDAAVYREVTVEASRRLLQAVAQRGQYRVIFVSSLSVYRADSGGPITEESPLAREEDGRSDYARTKTAADLLAQQHLDCPNTALTIVRPGVVYGAGMANPLTGVALPLRGKAWLAVGYPDKPLPLIYVEDLVEALIRIAGMPEAAGQIYNLIDAETPTHREYLAAYRQVSGDRRPLIRLPLHAMVLLLGAVDRMSHDRFRLAPAVRRMTTPLEFSARRASQELGIAPHTPLAAGLAKTLAAAPAPGIAVDR
jgi:nucleoside-diphosphate-sugar epimerase